MNAQEYIDGLTALGFTDGFAIGGDPAEITLWENEAKQPTDAAISKAAPKGAYEREYEIVRLARHAAYTDPNGSDAVFMKYQRDEATKQEWLNAKAAIDTALPYPTAPKVSK